MSRFVRWGVVFGVVAVAIGVVVATSGVWRSTNELKVSVLDVGQGDAILVEFPSGQRWLIDGGPDDSALRALDRGTFMRRPLTGIIVTHPHADHLAGLLPIAQQYQIGQVIMPSVTHTSPDYQQWLKLLQTRELAVMPADHPFVWEGDDQGVHWRWEFFYPTTRYEESVKDLNDVSVVSRLQFGERSFLFTGDATSEVESTLLASGRSLKADVLKVGHHGSDTSTTPAFLSAVQPSVAIISVAAENSYNLPKQSVIDRLAAAHSTVYRTDKQGTITIYTDGQRLTVEHGSL